MGAQTSIFNEPAPIPEGFRFLLEKSGKTLREVAADTGIPHATLYSMASGRAKGANILTLKRIADYFQEDLSVFCGIESYVPQLKLSEQEKKLISQYRQFTEKGKRKVEEHVDDLFENPKNLRSTG